MCPKRFSIEALAGTAVGACMLAFILQSVHAVSNPKAAVAAGFDNLLVWSSARDPLP